VVVVRVITGAVLAAVEAVYSTWQVATRLLLFWKVAAVGGPTA
jgi:hypothetical protein